MSRAGSPAGYWVFRDKRDGRQVEWSDELCCWLVANGPSRVITDADHADIEMVRVELTTDVHPITVSEFGTPIEPYEGAPDPPLSERERKAVEAMRAAVKIVGDGEEPVPYDIRGMAAEVVRLRAEVERLTRLAGP